MIKQKPIESTMEIRIATKDDFEEFVSIKEKFFKDYRVSKKSRFTLLREFGSADQSVIIAKDEKKIIGYLIGRIEEDTYGSYGFISEFFVAPEYRKNGVATKLKDRFLEILKSKNIPICRAEVYPELPGQGVYERWGFKVDKIRMCIRV